MKLADSDLLSACIRSRAARVAIVGLGYVGLPLALNAARKGYQVTGFDTDAARVNHLNRGMSPVECVDNGQLARMIAAGRFSASEDFSLLRCCDVVVICVPTPLTPEREPDLSCLSAAAEEIVLRLRTGQLVVLESTTWPGTTQEMLKPVLQSRGLVAGTDFWIAYAPEREDPGNREFGPAETPRIVAGDCGTALRLVTEFYSGLAARVVPVSSTAVAEAAKMTENVFRAVNIALVNELKVIYETMGIDIWEVIDAAATKPFGYMPFHPGPGMGGHCIPVDPFYLAWKARQTGVVARFVELAGEVNHAMPHHVVARLDDALMTYRGKPTRLSRILILGVAYKKNVSDIRESPALELACLLESRGAEVRFHDPHVNMVPLTQNAGVLGGRRSVPLDEDSINGTDAVLIVTDHDLIDYRLVGRSANLIVDTRNAMRSRGIACHRLVFA